MYNDNVLLIKFFTFYIRSNKFVVLQSKKILFSDGNWFSYGKRSTEKGQRTTPTMTTEMTRAANDQNRAQKDEGNNVCLGILILLDQARLAMRL
jgi:hypothetical protein